MRAAALRQPRRRGRSVDRPELDAVRSAAHASQKDRVEGAPFGTRGGTVVTHNFPADGKYKFQMLLHGEPTGLPLRPHRARASQMEVAIDGERVALREGRSLDVGVRSRTGLDACPRAPIYVRAGAATRGGDVHPGVRGRGRRSHQADRSHAGRHANRRRLRRDDAAAPAESRRSSDRSRRPACRITRRAAPSSRAARRRPAEAVPCARAILERLATQAYRAAGVTTADVDELMPLLRPRARKTGGFEGGIRTALQAHAVEPALRLPRRRDAGRREAGRRRTASATSISRRACRSSCGARFPTAS